MDAWPKNEERPFEITCFQFLFIFVFKTFFRVDVDMAKKKEEEKPFEARVCGMQHGY